jgi:predicted phage replisome organizer
MADVKWIKLTTDMFENRKIKHLRRLPDGNNIVLLWIMLLTMAGRCNAGGMIFLTENIPYTPKMLADELDLEENTVTLGLQALEQLQMVVTNNGFFSISGWEEYQNTDKLAEMQEKHRLRQAKYRQKQKFLQGDATVTSPVTLGDALDIDKEEELEKELELNNNNSTPTATKKHKYGEHNNVLLTDEEYKKLQEKFPYDYEEKINTLSEGLALKGYKYKSHYLAVLKWAKNEKPKPQNNNVKQKTDYEQFMDGLSNFVNGG